jgi:FixJ family two-component response regulator
MTRTEATVFIVDDDQSVRKSLLRLVRSSGLQAEAFASAEEFLARPPFSGIGCLLLDVRMPGMLGPELRDLLIAQNNSLPIIFMSGHAEAPASILAWKEGVVDFLVKPVRAETLLQAIELGLERHAAAQNHKNQDSFHSA